MAEVRHLLPDESEHILENNKIRHFQDFSFEVISHSFNGVEIIANSSKNEGLMQFKDARFTY